jgi:hypothetical protein
LNTYAYVENNPLELVDPEGLDPEAPEAGKGKFVKPANPNKKPPPAHRVPGGDRERNVKHPDGEEHSRRPKGGFKMPSFRIVPLICPLCEFLLLPTEKEVPCKQGQ